MPEQTHRHAAIMFTDIVGYTVLMGSDEDKAFEVLRKNQEIHANLIQQFNGTLIKEMGDGMLVSFHLASEAVRCAIEIQKACIEQDIPLKIGIHEGEMVFAGADVLGDGVNIASRLQDDADEGSISISSSVYKNVKNKSDIHTRFVGEKTFKNVDDPVKVYKVLGDDKELQPKQEEPKKGSKQYLYYLLGGVVIIIAALLAWKYLPEKSTVELEKSIAVLPFKSLSDDPDKQYQADGVCGAITSHLAKISALRVIGGTSVEQYRDHSKDVRDIGEYLNVSYIVGGSFQLIDDDASLRIQLINTRDGSYVWTNEYDSEWSDIFKVQSTIAQTIAREINAVINPREKQIIETVPTHNLTAYDFYLQAEEYLDYSSKLDNDTTYLNKALTLYQRALEYDSTFAEAYLGLAIIYIVKNPSGIDSCQTLIDIALSYNDQLEKAYIFRGSLYAHSLDDFDQALIYYDKAIAINPNYAAVYGQKAFIYSLQADFTNAIPNIYKSLELDDPIEKPGHLGTLSSYYAVTGFYEKSVFYAEEKLKLDADSIGYYYRLAGIDFSKGNLAKSLDLYSKTYSLDSTSDQALQMMIQIHTIAGEHTEALHYARILDSLIVKENLEANNYFHRVAYAYWINDEKERARYYFDKQLLNCQESIKMKGFYAIRKWAYYDLAAIYAFYDDKENAYQYLNEYSTKRFERSFMIRTLETDPLFNNIRKEERFQKIYEDMKSKYQAEHDKIKVWMEEEGML